MNNRRQFLAGAGAAFVATLTSARATAAMAKAGSKGAPVGADILEPGLSLAQTVQRLASLYDVDRSIANFDAAYYGAMTRSVHAAYLEKTAWVNRYNSTFLRSAVPGAPHVPAQRRARRPARSCAAPCPAPLGIRNWTNRGRPLPISSVHRSAKWR